MNATLLRQVRPVPVGAPVPSAARPTSAAAGTAAGAAASAPVDVRVAGGVVTEVGPALVARHGDLVLEGDGRWVVPGLWDQHVHLTQWAQTSTRLDLSPARSVEGALAIVRAHLERGDHDPARWVIGAGHRSVTWPHPPTVDALDAVCGGARVALVSGDCHHGWLSSAALASLGFSPRESVVEEDEWFPALARLDQLPDVRQGMDAALARVAHEAAARGVVGVTDMEMGEGHVTWPHRVAAGVTSLRVRAAVYPGRLDDVIARGLRTGDPLGARDPLAAGRTASGPLVTMGPLKIISDGSLNTRTASCCEPYADAGDLSHPSGRALHGLDELVDLLGRARRHRLDVALHAIGDAAVSTALDAFEASGARGGIEHAQLVRAGDVERMARLGVRASVQPAHLIDDRDASARCWPDRLDRCFPLASMWRAGVDVVIGSDAPVAPLDPWLAMAAAVHRSGDQRAPWNPGEQLTAAQALAASTDGQPTVGLGSRGDLAVLDHDPLAPAASTGDAAAHLRATVVAATLVAGRPTHLGL